MTGQPPPKISRESAQIVCLSSCAGAWQGGRVARGLMTLLKRISFPSVPAPRTAALQKARRGGRKRRTSPSRVDAEQATEFAPGELVAVDLSITAVLDYNNIGVLVRGMGQSGEIATQDRKLRRTMGR